jgi:hypothetical protein
MATPGNRRRASLTSLGTSRVACPPGARNMGTTTTRRAPLRTQVATAWRRLLRGARRPGTTGSPAPRARTRSHSCISCAAALGARLP